MKLSTYVSETNRSSSNRRYLRTIHHSASKFPEYFIARSSHAQISIIGIISNLKVQLDYTYIHFKQ